MVVLISLQKVKIYCLIQHCLTAFVCDLVCVFVSTGSDFLTWCEENHSSENDKNQSDTTQFKSTEISSLLCKLVFQIFLAMMIFNKTNSFIVNKKSIKSSAIDSNNNKDSFYRFRERIFSS